MIKHMPCQEFLSSVAFPGSPRREPGFIWGAGLPQLIAKKKKEKSLEMTASN